MKILNYGSMNLDYVYSVEHIVSDGETIQAKSKAVHCGGKGLNQSIAVARAGSVVYHAGIVGADGDILLSTLESNGVDTSYIKRVTGESSHTIIQVDSKGQNCIIVFSGESMKPNEQDLDRVLAGFDAGDILIVQNELFNSPLIVEKAASKGMSVILNPSPINDQLNDYPLEKVDWFILNEIEAEALTKQQKPDRMLRSLEQKFPNASVVLTLGERGACLRRNDLVINQPSYKVDVVDTTAAGDTFTGYFIAGYAQGLPFEQTMRRAAIASSLAIGREGAATSIPVKKEIDKLETRW